MHQLIKIVFLRSINTSSFQISILNLCIIHLVLCTIFLVLYLPAVSAQSKLKLGKYHYDKEYTYGVNFNTNGRIPGGFTFKYAIFIKPSIYHSFFLEFVNVKHSKEFKKPLQTTGNTYVKNKQNFFFVIRPQYGREFILFKKIYKDDFQIDFICSFGPSIGILKPYYILYDLNESIDPENQNIQSIPFNPNQAEEYIYGSGGFGGFVNGFDQSKFKLGANLKTSISVEFGDYKNKVIGIETGFLLETYPDEIIIIGLPNEADTKLINKKFFSSAFITFYWGKRFLNPIEE